MDATRFLVFVEQRKREVVVIALVGGERGVKNQPGRSNCRRGENPHTDVAPGVVLRRRRRYPAGAKVAGNDGHGGVTLGGRRRKRQGAWYRRTWRTRGRRLAKSFHSAHRLVELTEDPAELCETERCVSAVAVAVAVDLVFALRHICRTTQVVQSLQFRIS